MQIRFLHISDIHCGYNNYGVNQMREKLAPQLLKFTQNKGQTIDYLFITGDLKYGPTCKEGYPPEALDFVREIQSSFGIKPDHTFVVPGNHDVKRGDMRTAAINGIKADYKSHIGSISDEHLMMLDMTQREYRSLYQEICGNSCRGNHFFVDLGPVNVIHLNTALTCGKLDKERHAVPEDGSLIVGMSMLRDALNGMDTSKPAIVLAHHSLDCLAQEEQMKLERLLKEKNALVYLCGHKHVNLFHKVETEVKDKPLWEILCGTNMDSAPSVEQTEMSVYVGTLDTTGNCGYIDAYKWSRRNEEWMPDSEFSHRENGSLDGRFYFPSREVNLSSEASERYLNFLRKNCTDILLDGLPDHGKIGNRKFPIDSLFVPLHFSMKKGVFPKALLAKNNPTPFSLNELEYMWVYDLDGTNMKSPFSLNPHVVLLGGPGCGKTSYIKKTIYQQLFTTNADNPPLFPIWIRCRTINELSDFSLMSIISNLPILAEFPPNEALHQAFTDVMYNKLQTGSLFILIDGLDEISDSRRRTKFIEHLDAFSRTYPENKILVTSRYTGYNDYTKSGLSEFDIITIKDFTDKDIQDFCIKWHHTMINTTEETTIKARTLANHINNHDRIRSLAKNPLLLTTMLLVHQRVGQLPTKRATLYEEAIKVLLETWNQEGHAPLNLDISICKLAYIAYRMTRRGINQITRDELLEYLYSAKEDISRKLIYDSISPEDFLIRTEQRSSILIRVGFKTDEQTGKLHEIYEFQHLTFQEYLTAVAVENYYFPNARNYAGYLDILNTPHGLNAFDPNHIKKEVILLTASRIKWHAEKIALHLMEQCQNATYTYQRDLTKLGLSLLLDEVELEKDTQYQLMCSFLEVHNGPVMYEPTQYDIQHGKYLFTIEVESTEYVKLYQTKLRGLAADAVLKKAHTLDPIYYSAIAPYWRFSDDDFKELRGTLYNAYYMTRSIFLHFVDRIWMENILTQKPTISDGLLMFCASYFSNAICSLKGKNTAYAQTLISRLEEYHTQHPEIEDLSAKEY